LQEEPQEERGPKGSRDAGLKKSSEGKADRPTGHSDEKSDTSIQPKKPKDPDSPNLQSGG
jgi:hypothetical protein